MIKKILFLLLASTSVFASEINTINSTDIVWRTINFIVFAIIIWYLTANPVKNYLTGRTKKIADELQKVQDKINETKMAKDEAEQKLQNAKELTKEIVELSKKETKVILDSIISQNKADMIVLDEQNRLLMELEKRKMIKNVVSKMLYQLLSEKDLILNQQDMINIILKKVA